MTQEQNNIVKEQIKAYETCGKYKVGCFVFKHCAISNHYQQQSHELEKERGTLNDPQQPLLPLKLEIYPIKIKDMTQEEKDLLLKDLCGRLPYDIIVQDEYGDYIEINIHTVNLEYLIDRVSAGIVKIVLRSMSSMTEEEKKEYIEYAGYEIEESVNGRHYEYYLKDFCGTPDNPSVNTNGVDWLNKKMFDFRGLIPKGLAIEVTEENNPYKE